MFEKFTSLGSMDFKQRYQGTYGFFTNKGKRHLARLENVQAGGSNNYVEFVDRDGMEYKLLQDSVEETCGFEFIPPKCAYYNTPDGPLIVNRVPARQYLRGICDRNTSIKDLLARSHPVSFETLIKLFENKTSVKDALANALLSKSAARGVAISSQFAVGFEEEVIKCFNTVIGRCVYVKDSFVVTLESPELWQQEVTDAFKRANLGVVFK